jgi:hypothetical protein
MRIGTDVPSSASRVVPLTITWPTIAPALSSRTATSASSGIQPGDDRIDATSGGSCGSSNAARWRASIAAASAAVSGRMRTGR